MDTGVATDTSSDALNKRRAKKATYEPRAEHCSSPVRFAQEVLGAQLWSKQAEVLEALGDNQRVAVK